MVKVNRPKNQNLLAIGLAFALNFSANAQSPIELNSNEVARVSCDRTQVAKAIAEGKEVVPSLMFHYGKRSRLIENSTSGNIPLNIWQSYMRGPGPTLKQAPFRQGLYACTHPYDCSEYADYQEAGMMIIRVKRECRKPEAVASVIGLLSDARTFSSPKLRERLLKCYESPESMEYPEDVHSIDGAAHSRTDCENALEEFFETNQIKIAQDGLTNRSWYIRERDCIETLYGGDDDVLAILNGLSPQDEFRCKEKAIMNGTLTEFYHGTEGVERVLQSVRKNM